MVIYTVISKISKNADSFHVNLFPWDAHSVICAHRSDRRAFNFPFLCAIKRWLCNDQYIGMRLIEFPLWNLIAALAYQSDTKSAVKSIIIPFTRIKAVIDSLFNIKLYFSKELWIKKMKGPVSCLLFTLCSETNNNFIRLKSIF